MLSFGHAAFFGGAAYVAAHAAKVWGFPFELAVLAGAASAALLGLAFGVISIRRHGIYFAMITLALAQLVYFVALQAPFTHSEDGIQGVPRGSVRPHRSRRHARHVLHKRRHLRRRLPGNARIIHSQFGKVLDAIREDPARAPLARLRHRPLPAAGLRAVGSPIGLAGATKAIAFQFASLTDVHWATSGDVILMALLGGIGTTFGPVVGAIVIVSLDEFLAELGVARIPADHRHRFLLLYPFVSQRRRRDTRSLAETSAPERANAVIM